jgi:F-type H+-transporting ATPase subunit a
MNPILASVQAAGTQAPEQIAPEAATPDLGYMLMHKVMDAPYLQLDALTFALPHWEPVRIGGLLIDFSPTKHLFFVVLAATLCFLFFAAVSRAVRARQDGRAPTGFANVVEAMILYFRNEVVRPNIGHGADGFTPYILSLFFFILFMNLLGLVPFGSSATANLSVTAALALLSFILVEVSGFRELGPAGYARTIFYTPKDMHPIGQALMLVVMTPVEFIGKLTKPFALAIRLFANMTAGTILVYATIGLIFIFGDLAFGRWGVAGASVAMASAIMVLKIFVAFLQAYIFAMLTAVFIGLIRHAH